MSYSQVSSALHDEWIAAAELAAKRIPPLWPLKHFVAVNPFLEMIDQPFSQVAAQMSRMVPGGMLVEKQFFQDKYEAGEITQQHLEKATDEIEVSALEAWLRAEQDAPEALSTVAKIVDSRHRSNWEHEVVEEISHWLGAYLDQGQSLWAMPWKGKSLFRAWREAATIDCNPEMLGLEHFRRFVSDLPEEPEEAIVLLLEKAELPSELISDFLYRELLSVGGWASCLQYRKREGLSEVSPLDLLAIRLSFDVALLLQYNTEKIREILVQEASESSEEYVAHQLVWQRAFELAYCDGLISTLPSATGKQAKAEKRPFAQMVFCIDVRSEPMRRSIEAVNPGIATYGYAGFFGMPIEKVPFGKESGAPHCPVILDPPFRVREGLHQGEAAKLDEVKRERGMLNLWKGFKDSAVSCFSFVEAAGLSYGYKLYKDSFAHKKDKGGTGLKPMVTSHTCDHSGASGIPADQQVVLAKGVVTALNLNKSAARLVVLCGHGASTTNNPYDSGYQCGACGGHSGDFNSQLAAEIMNTPEVREGLKAEGMGIPDDVFFLAGRHDTTLDEVSLFDESLVPDSHHEDLETLKENLAESNTSARIERAPKLGITETDIDKLNALVKERASDWSQVRPEWGLAGNASFIVAPRHTTADLDLGGRAFLHHYETENDPEGGLLAAILGGPMVVGSWINLQYYASAANQEVFGSGHKTLHNVNGTHGVQLGNGGDLKTGLAFQSVHDGEKLVHEPSRLHVFVDAEIDKVQQTVDGNQTVKDLVTNRWVYLFAADGKGGWQQL